MNVNTNTHISTNTKRSEQINHHKEVLNVRINFNVILGPFLP